MSKHTRYFDDYESAYNYYGGNVVPSTEIALVGNGSFVFVSSDNSYNGGNTQYFDATMTNDEIVETMTYTAYNQGMSYGETIGQVVGYDNGYEAGYSYGYPLGYTDGTAYGEAVGYPVAYEAGYSYGYPLGYTDGTTYGEEITYPVAYEAGYSYGYPLGYTAGTAYGEAVGYTTGYTAGTAYGYEQGYSYGYSYGYDIGYDEGEASGTGSEPVDAKNLAPEMQPFHFHIEPGTQDRHGRTFGLVYNLVGTSANEISLSFSLDGVNWNEFIHPVINDQYDYMLNQSIPLIVTTSSWDIDYLNPVDLYIAFKATANCRITKLNLCWNLADADSGYGADSYNPTDWPYYLRGNVLSLQYGVDFADITNGYYETDMDYAMQNLFEYRDLAGTNYSPKFRNFGVKMHASELVMPTGLCASAFESAFASQRIVDAPELPATTLDGSCYSLMFDSCSYLTKAPRVLPATITAPECYYDMFYGCSSLGMAPMIMATTSSQSWNENMFYDCINLKYFPYIAMSGASFYGATGAIRIDTPTASGNTSGTWHWRYEYNPSTMSFLWSDDPEEFMLNVMSYVGLNGAPIKISDGR